jgi:hypothetical protein
MRAKRDRKLSLRRHGRARWTTLVALFIAGFVAFLPIAQAFCAIDLPIKGSSVPAAAAAHDHGDSHGGGETRDPCCDHSPLAFAPSDNACDDAVAGPGRAIETPATVSASPLRSSLAVLAQHGLLRGSLPPPEPRFRRLKRLLV